MEYEVSTVTTQNAQTPVKSDVCKYLGMVGEKSFRASLSAISRDYQ